MLASPEASESRSSEHLSHVLIDHAVSSIEAGEYSASPYPHLVFRDIFPDRFLQDLIRIVPNEACRAHRTGIAAALEGRPGDADLARGGKCDPAPPACGPRNPRSRRQGRNRSRSDLVCQARDLS